MDSDAVVNSGADTKRDCVKELDDCINNNILSDSTPPKSEVDQLREKLEQLKAEFSELMNVQLRPGPPKFIFGNLVLPYFQPGPIIYPHFKPK